MRGAAVVGAVPDDEVFPAAHGVARAACGRDFPESDFPENDEYGLYPAHDVRGVDRGAPVVHEGHDVPEIPCCGHFVVQSVRGVVWADRVVCARAGVRWRILSDLYDGCVVDVRPDDVRPVYVLSGVVPDVENVYVSGFADPDGGVFCADFAADVFYAVVQTALAVFVIHSYWIQKMYYAYFGLLRNIHSAAKISTFFCDNHQTFLSFAKTSFHPHQTLVAATVSYKKVVIVTIWHANCILSCKEKYLRRKAEWGVVAPARSMRERGIVLPYGRCG